MLKSLRHLSATALAITGSYLAQGQEMINPQLLDVKSGVKYQVNRENGQVSIHYRRDDDTFDDQHSLMLYCRDAEKDNRIGIHDIDSAHVYKRVKSKVTCTTVTRDNIQKIYKVLGAESTSITKVTTKAHEQPVFHSKELNGFFRGFGKKIEKALERSGQTALFNRNPSYID